MKAKVKVIPPDSSAEIRRLNESNEKKKHWMRYVSVSRYTFNVSDCHRSLFLSFKYMVSIRCIGGDLTCPSVNGYKKNRLLFDHAAAI